MIFHNYQDMAQANLEEPEALAQLDDEKIQAIEEYCTNELGEQNDELVKEFVTIITLCAWNMAAKYPEKIYKFVTGGVMEFDNKEEYLTWQAQAEEAKS